MCAFACERNDKTDNIHTANFTCLTSKEIDASGFNDVGGDMAEAHVKGSPDMKLFHFPNLIFWVWFRMRLRSLSFLPFLFFVVVPLGRNGAFDLFSVEKEKKREKMN